MDLVGIGDSLIAGHPWNFTSLEGGSPTGANIVDLLADLRGWTRTNQGLGSQTTTQIEARFDAHVVALSPANALINGGVNDIVLGGSKATFLANWTSMLNKCVAASIIPYVLLMLPWTNGNSAQNTARDEWNADLAALVATYPSAILVNADAAVGVFRSGGTPGNRWNIHPSINQDGVHFTESGYRTIAQFIHNGQGLMATFYVSTNGSDANNGQGPDASHATNKPWLTLGKALGAAGIASGDTVYVAPGVYRAVTTVNMTSPVAETFVLGDPQNGQGFKDGSGVLTPAGDVRLSAYTTNDTSAPSASVVLTLNARDLLTFRNLVFHGGTGACVNNNAGSVSCTFQDCLFITGQNVPAIIAAASADVAVNLTVDRCVICGGGGNAAVDITLPTSAVADYDSNILIRNCLIFNCHRGVFVASSGAAAFKGGGVKFYGNTLMGFSSAGFVTNSAGTLSTTIPCLVYNNVFNANVTGLSAATSGQITEDFNLIWCLTPRTNVTAGGSSKTSPNHAWLFEMGQDCISGRLPRRFMTPTFDSPALGFGNQSVGNTLDYCGRSRPSGGKSVAGTVGYLERHDTAERETTTVDAGSNAAKIIGPGDHDLLIPVDAAATTITIRARFDTNHGAGSKPQAILLASPDIGVTTSTATVTAAVDTWQTLTLGPFTPTAKGWVTLRLVSRAAAGNGVAFFDTLTVT